ncbi:MAG: hypothetical protein QOD86_292 [Miltoncostaeaceae bacterium]|jgi:hypothetical protein|nr:hypothetical protein [Miltoncostaeaceae bacterium]
MSPMRCPAAVVAWACRRLSLPCPAPDSYARDPETTRGRRLDSPTAPRATPGSVPCATTPSLGVPRGRLTCLEFADGPRTREGRGRSRPSSPHPEALPPTRRTRAGSGCLAGWTASVLAPRHGAKHGCSADVVPRPCSGKPPCAGRRVRHDDRAWRPAGDGGRVGSLRTAVHPAHISIFDAAGDSSAGLLAQPRSCPQNDSDPPYPAYQGHRPKSQFPARSGPAGSVRRASAAPAPEPRRR